MLKQMLSLPGILWSNPGWLQVVEISLQCTLFQRWDGIRIYYPNAKLSSEAILNVTRSANRWEGFKVGLLPDLQIEGHSYGWHNSHVVVSLQQGQSWDALTSLILSAAWGSRPLSSQSSFGHASRCSWASRGGSL